MGNDPLRDLGEKINSAKQSYENEPKVEDHHSGLQHAWRMVIELVSGLAIGFGLGYGLDIVFGTLPIFMIIFTLLGFVAGIRTMLSTAKEVQRNQASHLSEKNERNI
tara:strand:+ start:3145 stop:3465 length:321 start_codon:yes stop_codon:yes gene_type:complete